MFKIQGIAIFAEDDIHLGEQFENTLRNEGFFVKKDYILQSPAKLVLNFNVETTEIHKADTEFKLN